MIRKEKRRKQQKQRQNDLRCLAKTGQKKALCG